MKDEHYKKLIDRYLSRKATKEEIDVFYKLLSEGKIEKLVEEQMECDLPDATGQLKNWYSGYWLKSVAVILLCVTLGGIYYVNDKSKFPTTNQEVGEKPILPAKEKAILTLANGERVELEDRATMIELGGIKAYTSEEGVLEIDLSDYNDVETINSTLQEYNTIETPRGGTYKIVLPDKSVAWLNSDSKIRFPAIFTTTDRRVNVEGEVYFDVAHQEGRPFWVETDRQTIKVLGTQFNLNTYADEPYIKTTLIEGSVEVYYNNLYAKLKPGEQSILDRKNKGVNIVKVDTDNVAAWKEGFFRFDKVDLKTLMRDVARWYDIEVVYHGEVSNDTFVGKISRSEDIEEVIKILKAGRLNIELKGRKLIVLP